MATTWWRHSSPKDVGRRDPSSHCPGSQLKHEDEEDQEDNENMDNMENDVLKPAKRLRRS